MRKATDSDIPLLVDLMDDFYSEAGYKLNRDDAANAFNALINNKRLGQVWLIELESSVAGYLVLTYKFAMEYGGNMACLDDLFVKKEFRNRGLSTSALEELREFCKNNQIRAITVEVGKDNKPALIVYKRTGFENVDRLLLALALDDPLHLV